MYDGVDSGTFCVHSAAMTEEQTVELDIEKVVYPGKGLARLDGRAIFVRGALTGERVRVKLVRDKGR